MVEPHGLIVAIEPQRLVFQVLCANLALNSRTNVFAHACAVGAENGSILVPVLPPDQVSNFGGVSLRNAQQGELVPLRRLDEMGLARCHVLKIDVEGMEVEVLRGAAGLIEEHRPAIYAENDRKERSKELLELIWSLNYRIFAHNPRLYSPANFAADTENLFPGVASMNILCLPAERRMSIQGMTEFTAG